MKTAPVVALWALACTLALPAQAFNPQPDPPARIGAITLNPGQTLRVNARVIKTVSPSNADVPPGPCRVSLSFLDGGGRNLGLGTIVLLRQGQATRLDLIGDELSSTANPSRFDLQFRQRRRHGECGSLFAPAGHRCRCLGHPLHR